MLLDTFVPKADRDERYSVLRRRVRFLASRASAASNREHDPRAPAWQRTLIEATLWLDASESAVALEDYVEARACLRRGTDLFLKLNLPLGSALQRTFFAQDEGRGDRATIVLRSWH